MRERSLGAWEIALLVILLCFGTQAFGQQGSVVQSMQRLIGEHMNAAKLRDATYLSALAAKEAAWQAALIAEAMTGLKITGSATTFYTDRTEETQIGNGSTTVDRSFNANQLAIGARKPIYRKKDKIAGEQAILQFRQSEAFADQVEQELYGRVFVAWIDMLAARDQFKINIESLAQGQIIHAEVERRQQAGELGIDQLGLEIAKLHQLQSSYVETQSKLGFALRQLRELVGSETEIPEHFSLEMVKPNSITQFPEQRILEIIEQVNHELRAARFAEEAVSLEREKMAAERHPTLDLYATVSKGENDTASYIKDERRIGIQLVIPLWTSGSIDASIAQAEALYRKSQGQTYALAQRIRLQSLNALSRMQWIANRIEADNSQIQANEIRVQSLHRGFLAGTHSRGDLAKAESDYLESRKRRIQAMREFAIQWADIAVMTSAVKQPPVEISYFKLENWLLARKSEPHVEVSQAKRGG